MLKPKLGKADQFSTWAMHLFLFYKETVFRKLMPIMLFISAYAMLVACFDHTAIGAERLASLNLGQFHLVFSFILGIVVSFRVTTAYNRWWEGRILWGTLVNNCRNLALKFDNFAGLNHYPQWHACLAAFPQVLKLHLRGDQTALQSELHRLGLFKDTDHPVMYLLNQLYFTINQLRDHRLIRMEQYSALDMHVVGLVDNVGGCERLAYTPMPMAFAFFVKQAMLFYCLVFPFGWVDKFGFLIIPMIIMIVYVLLGLELLAEDLEGPFGTEEYDLPLDNIVSRLKLTIEGIAGYNDSQN